MTAPKITDKPSTRHHQVDHRFAAILEDDFGIPSSTVLFALEGEPQKQAIAICNWAEKTGDPAYALRCWARRHGRGRSAPSLVQGGGRSNTRQHGRASGRTRRAESLRGVLVDPARLNVLADRLGV